MHIDKDKLKDSLELEDIKKILFELGSSEPEQDRNGDLMFQTVCHSGDKHKLYYYEESKTFYCYTDCSESMDVYELVRRAKGQQGQNYSFRDAIRFVADITNRYYVVSRFGRDRFGEDNNKISDWDFINKFKRKDKINIDLPRYDETVLDVFLKAGYEPWEEEGISLDIQKNFGVRYYIKNDSVIIPHYDMDNNLIGIRQRNTREEDLDKGYKYTPVIVENKMYNHPLGMNLFGLNRSKEAIKRLGKIMLFEGEKSCMKAEEMYGEFNFTCATSSGNITSFQRDIILSLKPEEIFIAFDKYGEDDDEEKIKKYKEKLYRFAQMFTPYMKTYIIWDDEGLLGYKDAPIDRGRVAFERLMKNKYEIST